MLGTCVSRGTLYEAHRQTTVMVASSVAVDTVQWFIYGQQARGGGRGERGEREGQELPIASGLTTRMLVIPHEQPTCLSCAGVDPPRPPSCLRNLRVSGRAAIEGIRGRLVGELHRVITSGKLGWHRPVTNTNNPGSGPKSRQTNYTFH